MRYKLLSQKLPRRSWWHYALWVLPLAIVLLGAAVWWGFIRSDAPPPSVKQSVGATKRQAEAMTTHLLFVGDVNWGRQTQRRAESSGKSYDYITSGLSTADRSGYDAWIGNFECPITNRDVAYAEQVSILKFNCRPEYLPTLAKYFTASTLANNHMDNNGGQWGLDQTRQNLQQNGIQYFGTYNMSDTNDICEVISLPAKTTPGQQDVWLPVALCGYMYVVDATPTEAQLAVMHQYATVMPVIAMPHMGIEYRATAEAEKVSAYHRMIDNGADLVIGAHPHVIQNSESYQGRLIAYSVGNFLFDQQSVSAATNLALGVGVQLQIPAGKAVQAYQKLGSSCKAFKDDCLQRLAAMNTKRPPIGVAYTFSCYSITSGIPVAGTDAQCATAKQAATTDKLASLKAQW